MDGPNSGSVFPYSLLVGMGALERGLVGDSKDECETLVRSEARFGS